MRWRVTEAPSIIRGHHRGMEIDKSKNPTIVRLEGGVRVTIHLKGDEGPAWKDDYDTAAKESEIDAYAVPWAICVTVLDPDKVTKTLDAAVGLLKTANVTWSERNKPVQKMEGDAEQWWRDYLNPPPPTNRG